MNLESSFVNVECSYESGIVATEAGVNGCRVQMNIIEESRNKQICINLFILPRASAHNG